MNSNYIRLSEVLEQMDQLDATGNGVLFDIKFISCDRLSGTGGEIITIKKARKCLTVTRKEGMPVFSKESAGESSKESKNPNHYIHATRNILLQNGRIRKLHIRLIIEFNGAKVCF